MSSRKKIEEQLAKLKNDLTKKQNKLRRNEARSHVKQRLKELKDRNSPNSSPETAKQHVKPCSTSDQAPCDEKHLSVKFSLDPTPVDTKTRTSQKLLSYDTECHGILKQSSANHDTGANDISNRKFSHINQQSSVSGSHNIDASFLKGEKQSCSSENDFPENSSRNVVNSGKINGADESLQISGKTVASAERQVLIKTSALNNDGKKRSETNFKRSRKSLDLEYPPPSVNSNHKNGRGRDVDCQNRLSLPEAKSPSSASSITQSSVGSEICDTDSVITRKTRRKSYLTKTSRRNGEVSLQDVDDRINISYNLESQMSNDESVMKSPVLPKFYDGLSQCGPAVGSSPFSSPATRSQLSDKSEKEKHDRRPPSSEAAVIVEDGLEKLDCAPVAPSICSSSPEYNKEQNKTPIFPAFPKRFQVLSSPGNMLHFSLPDNEYVQLKLERLKRKLNNSPPVSRVTAIKKSADELKSVASVSRSQDISLMKNLDVLDRDSVQVEVFKTGCSCDGKTHLEITAVESAAAESSKSHLAGHATDLLNGEDQSSKTDTCPMQSSLDSVLNSCDDNTPASASDVCVNKGSNNLKVKRKRGRPRKNDTKKKKVPTATLG